MYLFSMCAMYAKLQLMVLYVLFLTLSSIQISTAQLAWSSIIVDSESKYAHLPFFSLSPFKQIAFFFHVSCVCICQNQWQEKKNLYEYSIMRNLWSVHIECKHWHNIFASNAHIAYAYKHFVRWSLCISCFFSRFVHLFDSPFNVWLILILILFSLLGLYTHIHIHCWAHNSHIILHDATKYIGCAWNLFV